MHLIDFGLSVLNTKKQSNKIIGTYEFMSINSHLKMPKSYQDDLISLGYILIYLINKRLPWSHLKDLDKILKLK